MLRMLLAGLLLQATATELQLVNRERCRDEDGYRIVRRHVYLSADSLSVETLTRLSMDMAREGFKGEIYAIVSSDLDFLQQIYSMPLSTQGRQRSYPFEVPIETAQPLAYVYWIQGNIFFQLRDLHGEVDWVVVQGENLLKRRFGGVEVLFVGERWGAMLGATACNEFGRSLTFISEQFDLIDEAMLLSIGDFYDKIFRRSSGFHLKVYETFQEANEIEKIVLPPLLSHEAWEKSGHSRQWDYWSSPISRKIQLYEGFGSPPVVEVELPPARGSRIE